MADSMLVAPISLLTWLVHQASLTEKLKSVASEVRLTVLKQVWKRAGWWEDVVINSDVNYYFQREIIISANEEPCWYARTLIPQNTYHANKQLFSQLATHSLGELIFTTNNIKRTRFFYYSINAQHIEYYWPRDMAKNDVMWVRSATFIVNQTDPFYLIEILLPALKEYC